MKEKQINDDLGSLDGGVINSAAPEAPPAHAKCSDVTPSCHQEKLCYDRGSRRSEKKMTKAPRPDCHQLLTRWLLPGTHGASAPSEPSRTRETTTNSPSALPFLMDFWSGRQLCSLQQLLGLPGGLHLSKTIQAVSFSRAAGLLRTCTHLRQAMKMPLYERISSKRY